MRGRDLDDTDGQGSVRVALVNERRQNLFFAFVYNLLGVPVAAGILYPFFGLLLSRMIERRDDPQLRLGDPKCVATPASRSVSL